MKKKMTLLKKLIIFLIIALIIAGSVFGASLYIKHQNNNKYVEVTPVSYLSTQYWGDTMYSSGIVSSDYVQELYPSDGRTITDIYVNEGDVVKIGDPILQYDKSRLELEAQTKELAIKQTQSDIAAAQKQLKILQETKPYVEPTAEPTAKPIPTPLPPTQTPIPSLKPSAIPTQSPTAEPTASPSATPTPTISPTPTVSPTVPPTVEPTATPTAEPTITPTPTPSIPPADVTVYTNIELDSIPYSGTGVSGDPYVFLCTPDFKISKDYMDRVLGNTLQNTSDPADLTPDAPFVVNFEIRKGNSNYGDVIYVWQIDGITGSSGFAVPPVIGISASSSNSLNVAQLAFSQAYETPQLQPMAETAPMSIYNETSYTKEELAELILAKRQDIVDLQFSEKQQKIDLVRANLALKNSTVFSTVNGVVKTLIDLDTAISQASPFLTIAGEDGYYIIGTISESFLDQLSIGDTISASSWQTGSSYDATVINISEYPLDTSGNNYGGGNPNSSTYEFTASISDPTGLTKDMYLDITMDIGNSSDDASILYLHKPYIRTDALGSYVMKEDTDHRLIRQPVILGKSIYGGEYIEIQAGLLITDNIAFPYGVDVKEGVRTRMQGSDGDDYPEVNDGDFDGGAEPFTEEYIPEDGYSDEIYPEDDYYEENYPEENYREEEPLEDLESAEMEPAVFIQDKFGNPLSNGNEVNA